MKVSTILAARDLNSRAETPGLPGIPLNTGNPVLDANLYDLSRRFCGQHNPDTVLQMLSTALKAANGPLEEHDLQIMAQSLKELYEADLMFRPYRNVRKITCFGSARITEKDPAYKQASEFAALAVDHGYMIITGGGPGLMQACNEGASEHYSFGLNITLPYEQHPNHVMDGSEKMMNFYYFFTRKLNFIKQTDALVALPGGFGTMDEIFETITLMQTGKSTLFPIVLLDPAGETFWSRWQRFIEKELLDAGLISQDDMNLLYHAKSAQDALACIEHFYKRFHSYYFEGDSICIRLSSMLPSETLEWICRDYADLLPAGDLMQMERDEHDHESMLSGFPRLRATFRRGDFARLRELIDTIND